jgi:hypothetical protein
MFVYEIEGSSEFNVRGVYAALNGFSTTVTSFALYSQMSWPNLTLPHFSQRSSRFIGVSGAEHILLCPIVTTTENEAWEEYAEQNHQWMIDMMDLPEKVVNERVSSKIRSDKPRDEIIAVHEWISKSTGIPFDEIEDIYQVPAWQMYPMVSYFDVPTSSSVFRTMIDG